MVLGMAELSFSWVRELEDKKTNKVPDTVTFECELSVEDAPVEWYKGDRSLKNSDKYQIVARSTIHKLTINDVDSKDAGEYSAIFKNKPTKAKLTVEGCRHYSLRFLLLLKRLAQHEI